MEISMTLRRYLQLAHDAPARMLSTDEITQDLAAASFSDASIESARRVLETADACKFSPEGEGRVGRPLFEDTRSVIADSESIRARSHGASPRNVTQAAPESIHAGA